MVIDSFAGYSSLGWYLGFLDVCIMFDYNLQTFSASNGKSGVILIGLFLYVTWPFSFVALNILSLFCMFSALIIMWQGVFFLKSSLLGVL